MAYDYEGNYVDERGMVPNPEFAVMPEPQAMSLPAPPPTPIMSYEEWLKSQPQPPPVNPDFAVMPEYNPYDTQPKPYDPYNLDRNDKPTVYPYDTQPLPDNLQPYNPYDTQPKPYQPYETLPLPDNLQPYNPYDTQPKQYDPYNPDRNDKPTVYPYDTAPSSAMNIGQILAGIGYGNSSQPAPTMAPMASGTAVAAPGIGSDLASLLRRYYGK
jgi:hypothetical protein